LAKPKGGVREMEHMRDKIINILGYIGIGMISITTGIVWYGFWGSII